MVALKSSLVWGLLSVQSALAAGPFFQKLSSTDYILGNDIWNITVGRTHGRKLFYKDVDLVGIAAGVYVSHSQSLNNTSLSINPNKLSRWWIDSLLDKCQYLFANSGSSRCSL